MEVVGVGGQQLGGVPLPIAPAVIEGFGGRVPEFGGDEGEVFPGGGEPRRFIHDDSGAGQRAQEESVPRGEDFVVKMGPDTLLLHVVEFGLHRGKQALLQPAELAFGIGDMQDVEARQGIGMAVILEISLGGDADIRDGEGSFILGEDGGDFSFGEAVELAFLPFTVGILGGVKAAVGVGHVALEITDNIADHGMVLRIAADQAGIEIKIDQLGIVIEHFLEVRDEPFFIHRVAGEAAAQLVIHAAGRHPAAGEEHLIHQFLITGGDGVHQDQARDLWLREFGGSTEAAVFGIEVPSESRGGGGDDLRTHCFSGGNCALLFHVGLQLSGDVFGVFLDPGRVLLP